MTDEQVVELAAILHGRWTDALDKQLRLWDVPCPVEPDAEAFRESQLDAAAEAVVKARELYCAFLNSDDRRASKLLEVMWA